jgi:Fur family ferric uptake transcriptional regulator
MVQDAADLIRRAGGRVTAQRGAVLDAVLAAGHAISQPELDARFGTDLDRVTIYRVLDWLESKGLVHRLTGDDRVWRFSAGSDGPQHVHFQCVACGRVECLEEALPARPRLPAGYRAERVELVVRGRCADCA